MRRAPQEGQKPRPLQLNPTSPNNDAIFAAISAVQIVVKFLFNVMRQHCAGFGFYLGEKRVDVFAHQQVQHGGFRAAAFVVGMGLRSLRVNRARRANSSRRVGLHLLQRGLGFLWP